LALAKAEDEFELSLRKTEAEEAVEKAED